MNDPVGEKIASLQDWRGSLLARLRVLILKTDAQIVEDIKWRKPTNPLGVPTWSREGIICTGETYRDKVKFTFINGAKIPDPHELFNASLSGIRRAVDFREDDRVNEAAFKAIIREAIAVNLARKGR